MPGGLSPALQGLWADAAGEWDKAHRAVQDAEDRSAAWVHAYLHRKEGDRSNAGYWYSRAGREASTESLDAEWERIVAALLESEGPQ